MPEFNSPVDIGNRALQHVGAEFIDPALGFTEQSKRAEQVSAVYGKVRRAELRRNGWRFAIRKTALRAVDSNTMQLKPTLWSSAVTYSINAIVIDQFGTMWRSLVNGNINNSPGQVGADFAWEPYFGPLSVSLYDSSQAYFAGELVYTTAGDGTYNVYYSNVNANAVHPALPNQWSENTTYYTGQVVQTFATWSNATGYARGATLNYTDGNVYTSLINANLNHIPPNSPTQWALQPTLTLQSQAVPIFGNNLVQGPQSSPVLEWTIGSTYSIGTFVMFDSTMWVSIANNNTGNIPDAASSTFWAAVIGGTFAMSAVDLNFGNNPGNTQFPGFANPAWSVATTYNEDDLVTGSDGNIYISTVGSNIGNNPVTDSGAHWLLLWTIITQPGGNSQWTPIGGSVFTGGVALTTLPIGYPLNSAPVFGMNGQGAGNRNMYRLPAGYLSPVMQDPKAGSLSFLGAPSGLQYRDWLFEGNYVVTQDSATIVLRFIADFTYVGGMDDMFCEGLAARIAVAICEPLTQSTAKIQSIRASYKEYMGEARLKNAIEIGAEEPPQDDYISARY
jgi:hypothetical protein